MNNNSMFESFIQGLDKNLQAQLSYYFRKQMILEDFAKSKEMQKMKAEIIDEVLQRISLTTNADEIISQIKDLQKGLDDLYKTVM